MAGHSQFKNIMYRKGAQDAKKAKAFAKIGREILVAAKSGVQEPQANPRLRAALLAARAVNMPNDNVNRILKKASGNDCVESYEEVRYEGFSAGGVSVIVEALTENRNRTFSEVRLAFSRFGGTLGESGSVSFMFEKVGKITFPLTVVAFDSLFEQAVESGAENVEQLEEEYEVTCSVELFGQIRDFLTEQIGEPLKSEIVWNPLNTIVCDLETMQTLIKLIDTLEDNDDVQKVFTNFECSAETQEKLNQEFE